MLPCFSLAVEISFNPIRNAMHDTTNRLNVETVKRNLLPRKQLSLFKKGEYMHDKVNPASIKNMSLAAKTSRKTHSK